MTIWSRINDALTALAAGEGFMAFFDRLFAASDDPPERSVAFTIAVIALGAKMAKADGEVTRDEVWAFRQVLTLPDGEEANAARVFNLARQDVAGFDGYARKIGAMFDQDSQILIDLMEGLFHISMADGHWHPREDAFLAEVARSMGIPDRSFRAMRARFVPGAEPDPFEVLGIDTNATLDAARAAWKTAVRNSHPDQMIARGVPPEAVKLAERRLIAINAAWDAVQARADA